MIQAARMERQRHAREATLPEREHLLHPNQVVRPAGTVVEDTRAMLLASLLERQLAAWDANDERQEAARASRRWATSRCQASLQVRPR